MQIINELIKSVLEITELIVGSIFALLITALTFVGCSSIIWIPALLIYLLVRH